MRFVKAPKNTHSLATTRGWSGRSHHKKAVDTPTQFVAVDGEGMTVDGEHRYVLFGIGDRQLSNPSGLHWEQVFDFSYGVFKPRTAYVGFFLGYDFTQIFRTLPEDRARILLTSEGRAVRKHRVPGQAPHPVECNGWQFDILGMKRLRLRPKGCDCPVATCKHKHEPWMYICDVGSFFQTSFLKVIDPKDWNGFPVVTPEEYDIILRGKASRSTAVLDEEMLRYNALENQILSRVMGTLESGFHGISVHLPPSKWFGPGQAAQSWLKSTTAPTGKEVTETAPAWFLEAARMAYFGGWFEIMMHGIIPGETHEYDINSAYPSIISKLPCLRHGTYALGEGTPRVSDTDLCLVYARVCTPDIPRESLSQSIGAMLHRDSKGRILRPKATEGWFWYDELQAAVRARLVKSLRDGISNSVLKWVAYSPCDCLPPMADIASLYLKRIEVGKTTPLGKAAKLVYNSTYGKFAQSIGDPIFGNAVYASRITSGCRTQILHAIASHPGGMNEVAMVATDGVYFLSPHPGLPITSALGEWDHTIRSNLTLFKPGVYWDDTTRRKISEGESASFKARGFSAADFASVLGDCDNQFKNWLVDDPGGKKQFPICRFTTAFTLTTGLQALRRGKWGMAGRVETGIEVIQDSDPSDKRTGLYHDVHNGRPVWRSSPHTGIINGEWIPSVPYEKRFGMEDPFSDEYREQYGHTPDGDVLDVLAWILKGE